MKLTIFALAAALFATPALAQDTVTIGTEGAFAPWNMTKPDGTLEGFEIELAADLCGRMRSGAKS